NGAGELIRRRHDTGLAVAGHDLVAGGVGRGLLEPRRGVGAVLLWSDRESAVEVARIRRERRVRSNGGGPEVWYRPPGAEALSLGLLGDVLSVLDVVVYRRSRDAVGLELDDRLFDRRRGGERSRTTEVVAIDGAGRDPDLLEVGQHRPVDLRLAVRIEDPELLEALSGVEHVELSRRVGPIAVHDLDLAIHAEVVGVPLLDVL